MEGPIAEEFSPTDEDYIPITYIRKKVDWNEDASDGSAEEADLEVPEALISESSDEEALAESLASLGPKSTADDDEALNPAGLELMRQMALTAFPKSDLMSRKSSMAAMLDEAEDENEVNEWEDAEDREWREEAEELARAEIMSSTGVSITDLAAARRLGLSEEVPLFTRSSATLADDVSGSNPTIFTTEVYPRSLIMPASGAICRTNINHIWSIEAVSEMVVEEATAAALETSEAYGTSAVAVSSSDMIALTKGPDQVLSGFLSRSPHWMSSLVLGSSGYEKVLKARRKAASEVGASGVQVIVPMGVSGTRVVTYSQAVEAGYLRPWTPVDCYIKARVAAEMSFGFRTVGGAFGRIGIDSATVE